MPATSTAAFFRVEGALVARPSIAAAAYLVLASRHIADRVTRLSALALSLPVALSGDHTTASRLQWMGLRGMSEDRLVTLGEEYGAKYLVPHVREAARRLLDEARRAGHRVILVSDSLDVTVRPLAAALGVAEEDVVANVLELGPGSVVTGRLREPIVGTGTGGTWARKLAGERGLDLARSLAYGAHGDDALLLSVIGRPCCVAPDRVLRRVARDSGWPVVEA